MSLIGSLLGLVLIPLKATRRELAAERPKEVENLAVKALAEEVKLLQLALDHWRNAGTTLMAENERLRRERLSLFQEIRRLRPDIANDPQQFAARNNPTSPCYRRPPLLAQYQQGMNYANLMQDYAGCTCVPARSRALGVHPAEPLPP